MGTTKIGDVVVMGGHRAKLVNNMTSPYMWQCVDCELFGEHLLFTIGIDGCPKRPESLNYLSLNRREGEPEPLPHEARNHWFGYAERIGLKVEDIHYVDDSREICAGFFFHGQAYWLRYNQPGSHGVHHIHAVKIEE